MRNSISLNPNWKFSIKDQPAIDVNIPHTWNAIDGQDGGNDYYRGIGTYEKTFAKPDFDANTQDVYLEFCGVNATATVLLNGQKVASHDGGYSTFRANVTALLQEENDLRIAVDNTVNTRVYPQKADFTFYGGIYRDVNLLVVSKNHFELDYYGMSGMQITPEVKGDAADVNMESYVYLEEGADASAYAVELSILDHEGQVVLKEEVSLADFTFDQPRFGAITDENWLKGKGRAADLVADVSVDLAHTARQAASHVFHMDQPHLWKGVVDPYLYTAKASLLFHGQVLDEISQRFGVRSFAVYPDKGFYLNGKPYPLHGVSRHQDFKGIGNAIPKEQHKRDMELIKEIGANTVRLAHYQHDQYFYDLCDEEGMVVWAEIPYISEHIPSARANTITQMRELILQNYNHTCIVTWGLSNEITMGGAEDADLIENHNILNDLCHQMDPTRLTTMAVVSMCSIDAKYVQIPDVISYNHYYGWYGGTTDMNGEFMDDFHKKYPNIPIGMSEYGCEALNWHTSNPVQGDYTEEYQAYYHEELIKQLFTRDFIWATHVWNMYDFAADARAEGGENGMNHKGLVTFDRKYKKDAFYAYKAWLSDDPFVHICGKRYVDRVEDTTKVTVYSNQPEVELFVNGESLGKQTSDVHFFYFDVPNAGESTLVAKAGDCSDESKIRKVDTFNEEYRLKEEGEVLNWFDIDMPEGYFNINDQIGDIMKTIKGKMFIGELMLKIMKDADGGAAGAAAGVDREGMMKMLGGFSVKRMLNLMGTAGGGKQFTKEELLELNRKLNKIKRKDK